MDERPVWRSRALDVPHGFFGRRDFADGSLADDAARLRPGVPLATVDQVHGAGVAVVGKDWDRSIEPKADALVTARGGVVLGIVTADCAPVLLADAANGVVGAAHAGWRGALAGVLEATVEAMCSLGGERARIGAAIGPTIARASYEVDAAMRDRFEPSAHRFFLPGRDEAHWQFDLPGYVAQRLRAASVASIDDLALDTYARKDVLFSFRRATHRGEPTRGRQLSAIALPG